ncbi:MAG: hypothetical protein ABIQ52_06340 [Vicinamibacterales bacterium]
MTTRQRLVAYLVLCSLAMTNVGCTSMKTVRPVTQPAGDISFGKLKAGDTVSIRTRDGRTSRFVVQQLDRDVIVAPDGVRYTSAEIVELKRRAFSGPKTAGLAAGIFGAFFLWAAIVTLNGGVLQ